MLGGGLEEWTPVWTLVHNDYTWTFPQLRKAPPWCPCCILGSCSPMQHFWECTQQHTLSGVLPKPRVRKDADKCTHTSSWEWVDLECCRMLCEVLAHEEEVMWIVLFLSEPCFDSHRPECCCAFITVLIHGFVFMCWDMFSFASLVAFTFQSRRWSGSRRTWAANTPSEVHPSRPELLLWPPPVIQVLFHSLQLSGFHIMTMQWPRL